MDDQVIAITLYIRATAAEVWRALTDPDVTQSYWGRTRIESDWTTGSTIRYRRDGDVVDEHVVLEVDPPRRLVHTFHPLFGEFGDEPPSRVQIDLEQAGEVTRLALRHDGFPPASKVFTACSGGWPLILSSLKTLLETGSPLPEPAGA
ncbi:MULTISPECIES: SRPBCC family protein [Ramlibacter]|uniref:ATPase n=1 Tax=Ramlibacter pinisoli TaxID=2682844 RepID=A0A6N8IZ32_9BURK|nr:MULTISPECIES: SRPBCC family protein [Ramlibacter]MBA2961899.1 SRPBCC family protein [Ramlibacter sp. CGMCC 1.13660]MVQ31842.1 ATPase [Ramlibacter pinisoli]